MARQRIHNSRTGTGAGNAGASWISYSDIMAALLLVFVLMLSVSLYRYFEAQTQKEQELLALQLNIDQQAEKLEEQKLLLISQQSQLDSQTMQLAAQQVTMDNQNAMIVIIQGQLDQKDAELKDKETQLKTSEDALAQAYIVLGEKENALSAALQDLEEQKAAFALQTSQLGSMVGVKAEIIREVSSSLSTRNITATVDKNSGDIVIDSNRLTFEFGKSELTAESKRFLDTFVPAYLDVLMRPEYADYLGSIIIEGHTDQTGGYETNMEISQQRALEVLLYIRSMYAGNQYMLNRLDQILVATGKGYSDPVYYTYAGRSYVDQDASRRVEFKFELRDSEMIDEINRLLNGQ